MDVLALTTLAPRLLAGKSAVPTREEYEDRGELTTSDIVVLVVSCISCALASTLAVYLSWTCHTAMGSNIAWKVICAIGAFLFGFTYLIYYVLFSAQLCTREKGRM